MKNKMRVLLAILALCLLGLCGCSSNQADINRQDRHFDKAIIRLADDITITVEIEDWIKSAYGEQLIITSTDGKKYLVSNINCTLIEE